jgi:hypothetical protein
MKYVIGAVVGLILISGMGYWALFEGVDTSTREKGEQYEREAQDQSADLDVSVVQYDAESAAECDAGDVFNASERVCEYECIDAAECAQLAQEAEGELAQWSDEYEKDITPVSEKPSGEDALSAEYSVSNDESIVLKIGKQGARDAEIWDQIAALSPDTFTAAYIESYGVFSDSKSDTLAYVHDEDGNGKWQVVVNVAGYESSTPRERATTLIHELGHVVTLNASQVNPNVGEDTCITPHFFTGEGCTKAGTYMGDFVNAFWSASDVRTVGGGAGDNADAAQKLYDTKPDAFVTDYAATNPGEDIAESFALFILDTKNSAPVTVAEKKVAFLYAYPSIVSFRDDMRQALVTGIVRAKRATR